MKIVLRESACEGKATGRQTRSILENTWSATGSPWGREWDGRMSENCWVTIDSLISKTQMNLQAKQEKQLNFSPLQAATCWKAGAQHPEWFPGKASKAIPKVPFLLSFPQLLLMNILYDIEYPVGQFGSAVPSESPHNLFPGESRTITLFKHCWRMAKTRSATDIALVMNSRQHQTGRHKES